MSAEEPHHVAMPKLYGAPAYARPPRVAEVVPRPYDPDELPLVVEMTDEERLEPEPPSGEVEPSDPGSTATLAARPFSLRALSDFLRRARG